MLSGWRNNSEYRRLSSDTSTKEEFLLHKSTVSKYIHVFTTVLCFVVVLALGFEAGWLAGRRTHFPHVPSNTAPRIPLQIIAREFVYSTPFSKEPPAGADEAAEPIWDALIPKGLGYFKDDEFAPKVSIPTVFHQLHCLYILRRAYYSHADDLQAFDFGKDRATHVAHCFDYLQQGLTCAADSTVEPAVDEQHGFLGSGFGRSCRDFEELRQFVERRRVFNATGFLAMGLEGGHAHIGNMT